MPLAISTRLSLPKYLTVTISRRNRPAKEGNTAFRNQLINCPTELMPDSCRKNWENDQLPRYTSLFSMRRASSRSSTRYLSDFPVLVSLVALFLACLGSGYLFHGFLTRKIKDLAILISLGASLNSPCLLMCW